MDSHLFKAGAVLGIAFVLYSLVCNIILYRSRAALKRATGAQSAKHYPQWDRIYGVDIFRDSLQAFREHRMLERSQERFQVTGTTTFAIKVLGRTVIMTLEPQNLKVIQALDHKKWGLGERRKTAFKPLLGDGKCLLLHASFLVLRMVLVCCDRAVRDTVSIIRRRCAAMVFIDINTADLQICLKKLCS